MTNKHILHCLILFATTLLPAATAAQEIQPARPVVSSWTVGIGSSHLADTYLTPLKYEGWSTGMTYERMQVSPWGDGRWNTYLSLSLDLDHTENPAKNATMWALQLHATWGMMHRWNLPWGLTAAVGPALTVEGGCLYNTRNSNNPASAKGAVTVDAIASVSRTFKLWRLPVTLRYMPSMPVLGVFFSPNYDELYYELYLGNRDGLVHPAWWGNRFRLDHLLTADLHFGSTALRLGYRCDWMNSHVNNLTTRMISHQFVVGVTLDWNTVTHSRRDDVKLPY